MKILLAFVAACSLAFVVPASAQTRQRIALLPVTGTNVHAGYLDAARDILKDHLLGTGRFDVITAPGEAGTAEISGDQAVAKARELNTELAVVVHLARLSGTGRLRLLAYRVSDGSLAHSDSLGVSGGPDDLDPALKRLAVGLATGKPAAENADIESVTQRDADPLRKQIATKIFGLRLGALVAYNRPGDLDAVTLPGLGVFWMYDARTFLGEVALDYHNHDSAGDFSITLGGYYPFTRENFTPYAGTSVSYAIVDLGGDGASGLRLTPTFGLLWGRLSTVQFRGEIGYFINTFGERLAASGQTPAQSASKSNAHGPTFSVGLGF